MKSKKLLATLLTVSIAASAGLTGCGNKEEGKNDSAKEVDKKQEGKSEKDKEQYLNAGSGEPTSLDPALVNDDTSLAPQGLLYEGLTRLTPQEDGTGKLDPGVAEKWEVSKDGLKYTFNLRKDAKWSDGKPVTAKDFEYSWKRLCDKKTGAKSAGVIKDVIKNSGDIMEGKKSVDELGVKAVDDYTFEVMLEKPCGYFMELTYFGGLKPVRKDIIEKHGKKYGSEAEYVVGNGAYTLKEWTHKNKLTFIKNENYWDKDKIHLTTINWKVMQDDNSKMQAFQNGELDSIFVIDPEWIEKFKQDPNNEFINSHGNNVDYLLMNVKKNKFLKNEKIRKALAVSFSREEFVKGVWNDQAVPMYGYVTEGLSLDGVSYKKFVDNDFIKKIQEENKDPKKLLQEGLKELGLSEDPSQVTFSLFARGTSEAQKQEVEFFQQKWKESLGINVKIEQMDNNIMYSRVQKGDFDMSFNGWFADYNDPNAFLYAFHSKDGDYKDAGWVNKKYDDALIKAKSTTDPKERAKLYGEAEKALVYEDTVIIPVMSTKNPRFRKKYIKNYHTTEFGRDDYKGVYTSGRTK
ncbi:peptide ABC transporter substrate-binding protein [Hathewaya histolytica]|uniref:Peptide ABC transporter substrate-binding protein n=1 Tax=Hathewaya histolytica TaxID=1498 RepID=A0A4U9RLE5_HATHI|nr:peptide ABC transporter substrate-binding protein [Hathewaya histolytica]VTQ92964.1 peptide ABC transporter substrate-binding protein [Hathewaya histolytica]